ncbi:MAG: glycosyl hydrolase family 57, partial [Leptolyngbyaceae cyanobacterium SU_3_3]|nr:glycosyl hydrolase family 57 [Leptolyngbyaceae cyanobacterium SU_3_3]
QMQPYYEAKTLARQTIGGVSIPAIVTQIGDGENGGVMMNEFPSAFMRTWHEAANQSSVVSLNGTEYLELIEAEGCDPDQYPTCQAVGQHLIWQRVDPDQATAEKVTDAIADLTQTQPNFQMDGASWTNNLSWVKGYENVLTPMNQLSALFHQAFATASADVTQQDNYRRSLLYNLVLQTSCFRYWGQGAWTDYAQTIYQQGKMLLKR